MLGACSSTLKTQQKTLVVTSHEPITIFYNGNNPPRVIFVRQEGPPETPPGPDYMAYGNYYWWWK